MADESSGEGAAAEVEQPGDAEMPAEELAATAEELGAAAAAPSSAASESEAPATEMVAENAQAEVEAEVAPGAGEGAS